jgi:cytidylate kinase
MVIVTLGGNPGSGKSTLGKLLAAKLSVPFFSMGDIFRSYAAKQGISIEELSRRAKDDPTIDHEVDKHQASLDEEYPRGFVVDSRLGYHFVPQAVKVFVRIDPHVAAARVFAVKRAVEHWTSVEEGERSLASRQSLDRERYLELYDTDPLDLDNYDLVLDSTARTPEELLADVLAYLRERKLC